MNIRDLLTEIADYCIENTNEFLAYHYEFKENKILSSKINENKNFVIKIEYDGREPFGSYVKYLVIGCDIVNRVIHRREFYIPEDDYDNCFQDESGDED